MTKFPKCLLTLGVLSLLAGCSGTTTASNCDGWRVIRPEKSDMTVISHSLVDQLISHNRYGQKQCGWEP